MRGEVEIFDGSVGMYTLSLVPEHQKDPLWGSGLIISAPEVVKKMHREYIQSGSTVVTTCTYQASLDLYCEKFGLSRDEAGSKLAESVEMARTCFLDCGKSTGRVAASVGSFGAHLCDMSEYDGSFAKTFSDGDMQKWHKEMVLNFAKTKPDLIGFETIPVIAELRSILRVMNEFPDQKFYVSFTCNSTQTLGSGELFRDAVKTLIESKPSNIAGIGINCSNVELTTGLLESAKVEIAQLGVPVLVMPNLKFGGFAPEEFVQIEKRFFEVIEKECKNWMHLGVRWFGLCCRTNPSHISRLKQIIDCCLESC